MDKETLDKVKNIKQSFRILMNGETARQMRLSGVNYHLNWGIALTDLMKMAKEYEKDEFLAMELWKENIRECKLLAAMLMPPDRMTVQLAELWMEQAPTQEIVEALAFHLLQYVDFAPELAFRWIAADSPKCQIGGYHILARLFSHGKLPDDREICEVIDQAISALHDESTSVKHAAYNCLQKLSQIDDGYAIVVEKALKANGF